MWYVCVPFASPSKDQFCGTVKRTPKERQAALDKGVAEQLEIVCVPLQMDQLSLLGNVQEARPGACLQSSGWTWLYFLSSINKSDVLVSRWHDRKKCS